MDPHESIGGFLTEVRGRLLRTWTVRVAMWVLAVLIVVAVLLPLASGELGAGRGVGATAAILAGIGVLVALGVILIVPRRRWRSDAAVARFVGSATAERHPRLRSDLLSAVELAAPAHRSVVPPAARRGTPSPALVEALLAQTAETLAVIEPSSLIDRRPGRRAAAALGGAVVVAGALVLVAGGPLARGWRRLIHPPPAPFAGATLSATPLVGDMRITLEYPAHAHRAPLVMPTTSGDFRAMAGTRVSIETTALVPVAAAEVLFEEDAAPPDAPPPAPAAVEVDGANLRVRFVAMRAGRYRFRFEAADHSRRVEAVPRNIEIEPDTAPLVHLYAPAEELDVSALKRVELAYTIEDDHGIGAIELVWEQGGKVQRKALPFDDAVDPLTGARRSAQAKMLWDLAEVALPPGERVPYHLEAKDNDDVSGPNVGRSRTYYLRVFSPREKNEQNIEKLRDLAERALRVLGGRLVVAPEDLAAIELLHRDTAEMVVEAGTLVAALENDGLASDLLRRTLDELRDRLDGLVTAEAKQLAPIKKAQTAVAQQPGAVRGPPPARLAAANKALVAELEDDVILLADWIDREHMETLLAIGDEIKDHQRRLEKLLEEYQRTGAPEIKEEIQRELRALEARLAELERKRAKLPEDVLDAFVNSEAMQEQRAESCFEEVQKLVDAGDVEGAKAKLAQCNSGLDRAAAAMEQSLAELRGDKFSEEQQKFQQLMDELADIAQDQKDIAAALDHVWDRYAERADELMRDKAKETRKKLSSTLEKLRDRLEAIPSRGLTPFSQEEMEIVDSRLDDLDEMLADGDLAEALAMARQAQSSLETIEAELDAALDDEEDAPWSGALSDGTDALRAVRKAQPLAERLVEELEDASPSPSEILSDDDRKAFERLQRRQQQNDQRAKKLAERSAEMSRDLPGSSGDELGERLGDARGHMGRATERVKAQDPSGARQEAAAAADALQKARQAAQGAARQQQQAGGSGLRDEPIRIPGADEYRAPEQFREDILEAMKKGLPPDGYEELVRRYYEELIR